MEATETEAGPNRTQQPAGDGVETTSIPPSENETECAICWLKIEEDETTILPCRHGFHAECLCGDVISSHFLRPGVTILPEELQTTCPLYQFSIDGHAVPRVGRPLNPDALERWVEIYKQLALLGGQELQSRMYAPWVLVHPGSNLFHEEDVDDPYAPPNVLPTDGELHMNMASLYEGHRSRFVDRPKKHNFRFVAIDEPQKLPGFYMFAKSNVAIAIEHEWSSMVNTHIEDLRLEFEQFRRRWPNIPLPINPAAFATLTGLVLKLKLKYVVFKRQHEGFIELSPVAVRYRDAAQDELQKRLDDFWEKFEWIRQTLWDANENVSL
ncbi:uncharacterized protein F4812DRAFT_458876 [Daldinia caldariorum]|uniref:uncharacterized protein n=1 Tax=Daldinia caldariorum TaxID=326644 RepID=UPI0020080473|nr:uncharacterized protein F4812DRAFT_458876 [Daldinia caldariorum]KAI1468442.1 hypothetical protein F4812DRAFT_458876 [Daldinia caldariorum]